MEVILNGSFDHFRPDELLQMLSTFRHSGVLEITCQERSASVFFDEGVLVHASSNTAATPAAVLSDLFVWPAGNFMVSWPSPLPPESERSVVDIDAAIREGRELLALYPSERIRLRVIEEPAPAEIHLTREEFRIVMKIGGGRSIRQLRADVGCPATVLYPLLHRLENGGILERLPAQDDVETVRNVDVDATVARFVSEEPTYVPPSEPLATQAALTLPDGGLLTLVNDIYLIGRDSESEIPIDDVSVSNRHARIMRRESGYVIEDTESRNGTYVNGEKIEGARGLMNEDVVQLGKITLKFNTIATT